MILLKIHAAPASTEGQLLLYAVSTSREIHHVCFLAADLDN